MLLLALLLVSPLTVVLVDSQLAITVLPFLTLSEDASVFTGVDDDATVVEFPMPFRFNYETYDNVSISSNGLVSFGEEYYEFRPEFFPLDFDVPAVISPYWDDIDLSSTGNIFFESYGSLDSTEILNTISEFISDSQSIEFECTSAVVVFWSDVCPFGDNLCNDRNSFQVVLASDNQDNSYAVFTYKCGLLNWSNFNAGIGYSAGDDFFMNHILSRQDNVNDIACLNQPNSPWSNVVYKVNGEGQDFNTFCTSSCNPRYNELQYDVCCDPENFGNFVKVIKSGIHRGYIACPIQAPDWCTVF